MAKQTINIGAAPNDGSGDPLRNAFDKANDNFDELYAADADFETRVGALEAAPGGGTGDMLAANNLSDLADVADARDNLSVYSQAEVDALVAGDGTAPTECIIVALGDETTAITAGTAKVTIRMPYAFTLTAVRASLTTAQASGSLLTVDINEGGASILSTKLTFDNTEKTTTTAATPPDISDTALADDAEITFDVDQVGNGTAKGLKVYLIGHQ